VKYVFKKQRANLTKDTQKSLPAYVPTIDALLPTVDAPPPLSAVPFLSEEKSAPIFCDCRLKKFVLIFSFITPEENVLDGVLEIFLS
tara:strand:- start:134 stop:394 length:261 start_codon:yes stop_codon:yes gene_type:complete